MHPIDYVIYSLWAVFWLAWLVAATSAKRAAQSRTRQFVGFGVARIVIVLLVVRFGESSKVTMPSEATPFSKVLAFSLFFVGLGLAVWARVHLGRDWGAPMSEKVDPELVTTGPYQDIRNPIYSGIMLAAIGTAVAVSWYWLVAVALMGAYFVYSATVEEHTMERLFPDLYPAYKRQRRS